MATSENLLYVTYLLTYILRYFKRIYIETFYDNILANMLNLSVGGVMVKAMDCGIVVREFVLQSRYYIHFRANTLGKGMNLLILPAMG